MKHVLFLSFSVILVVAAAFGYWFMHDSISRGVDEIAAARSEAEAASGREQFQKAASAFLSDTERERQELSTFIVQDADFVAAIETIEASAKREKVSVSVGSVTVENKTHQFHEVVTMTLSARGGFASLVAFAASLESLPFASRVQGLSIESAADKEWFLTTTIEFIKQKPQP